MLDHLDTELAEVLVRKQRRTEKSIDAYEKQAQLVAVVTLGEAILQEARRVRQVRIVLCSAQSALRPA